MNVVSSIATAVIAFLLAIIGLLILGIPMEATGGPWSGLADTVRISAGNTVVTIAGFAFGGITLVIGYLSLMRR